MVGKETVSGLIAIVNALDADFQKLTGHNGAAYGMSQIQLDNLAGQMTLFESAVDGLKLAVGEQLAPILRNIYEIGTNAFSWATEFVEENEWIVGAITGVAIALGALTAGVTALSVGPQIITALQAAIVQGREKDRAALNEQLANVDKEKGNFSNTVAEMETNFLTAWKKLYRPLKTLYWI